MLFPFSYTFPCEKIAPAIYHDLQQQKWVWETMVSLQLCVVVAPNSKSPANEVLLIQDENETKPLSEICFSTSKL